ncbi:DUF4199 domain-containing protein [Tenacibaculum sp. UWU-22]|uniref:DUF4199 domain-containing protein n=1 Tax=Tenacibaculum sp. UWU-22 TaxID=3234187 RepID=UPI0034DAE46F
MENQANSKSIIINYGLLLGGASVILSLIIYATGNSLNQNWITSVISTLLIVGFIVAAIKKFKQANGEFLSWGQAVKVGVGVAVVAGLILAIYNYIFMNFIEPDFMNQVMEKQQQLMIDKGLTDEQIETSMQMAKKFQSPAISAAMSIVSSAVFGFIISAIAGAILKKTEQN